MTAASEKESLSQAVGFSDSRFCLKVRDRAGRCLKEGNGKIRRSRKQLFLLQAQTPGNEEGRQPGKTSGKHGGVHRIGHLPGH